MKKDKILITIFLGILFSVLLWYPVKHILIQKNILTINMTDNWKFFSPTKENNFIDKILNKYNSKKVSIENRITNYFPFYISLNELYQKLDFYANSILYKDTIPIKSDSNNDFIFYNKKDDFFYSKSYYNKEELDIKLDKQIKFFNNLSDSGYDVYIYLPLSYQYTTLAFDNLNSYVNKFKEGLNKNINLKTSNINTIEDYKNYFYKTDHHWTIDGALLGYNSIMDMLNLEPVNVKKRYLTEKKYYGSRARSAMNDITYDYLGDIEEEFTYDVLVNGKEKEKDFKPRKLASRNYIFYDYYVQYFNGQYGEVVYDYHQNDKENVLIFSDSYVWSIDYLLASSFNKTYVINLRYDGYKDGEFLLDQYTKEHNIKKIIFIQQMEASMFDQNDYGYVRKVK